MEDILIETGTAMTTKKKQQVDLNQLAAQIARRLCTDGDGRIAHRLALMHRASPGSADEMGGGLREKTIRDIIIEELLAQARQIGLKVDR